MIYRPADTQPYRLVYALFIYVVIAGVGGFYRRRLHYFLRTRPRRQKNHTYCVKCSPSCATPAPPWIKSRTSLPRRSVGFLPPRIARPRLPSLALRMLSAVDRWRRTNISMVQVVHARRWTMEGGGKVSCTIPTYKFFRPCFGLWRPALG